MLFDNSMLNVYKIVSKYRQFTNLDPIEGDWDVPSLWLENLSNQYGLQTLTRLKGIETLYRTLGIFLLTLLFTNLDPIEGDWDILFWLISLFLFLSLQTLTRLKGIETQQALVYHLQMLYYVYKPWPDWRGLRLVTRFLLNALARFDSVYKPWPDWRGLRHCLKAVSFSGF